MVVRVAPIDSNHIAITGGSGPIRMAFPLDTSLAAHVDPMPEQHGLRRHFYDYECMVACSESGAVSDAFGLNADAVHRSFQHSLARICQMSFGKAN